MSPARVKAPRIAQGPEYVLRILSLANPLLEDDIKRLAHMVGMYYGGMHDYMHSPIWLHAVDIDLALLMRGGGLESAVRALNRRGYYVERVLYNADLSGRTRSAATQG